jgi:hypothetical protein
MLLALVQALQLPTPGLLEGVATNPVRIQAEALVGGPKPESALLKPSSVLYLRFEVSKISHSDAIW